MNGHTIYLGLGSNLGDRQLNLARALARLRQFFTIHRLSPVYETTPVGTFHQPVYLNMVVEATTPGSPGETLAKLHAIESEMGRSREGAVRYAPRPIDLDLLLFDDIAMEAPDLILPHPEMERRAFVLVPLADLAPHLVHPRNGKTIEALRDAVGTEGVWPLASGLLAGFSRDLQGEPPRVALGLARVGVTGLERTIQLVSGHPMQVFLAEIDLHVDLPAHLKGAHMSRFPYLVDETLDELARNPEPTIESLAGKLASALVHQQQAQRAMVHVRAKVPRTRHAPLSGQRTQDVFTLLGWAVSDGERTERLVGVEVEGMTVCPCALEMVRDHARVRLHELGLSTSQAEQTLEALPLASHSQRSRGRLVVTAHAGVNADDLVRLVEGGMSSEIYELLKRPDEFFVVNQAFRNPKFVEDAVRDVLHLAMVSYRDLPDDTFVAASQINFESIHRHDVTAERSTTLGALRTEMAGGVPGPGMRLEAWLDGVLEGK